MSSRQGEKATPEFHDWFKEHLPNWRHMAGQIIKKGEQHVPMLLVSLIDGSNRVVAVPQIDDVTDKNILATVHRRIASSPDVYAVVMVIEAWARQAKPDDPEYKSVSEAPDRREVMLFNALHGREQLISTCEINRADNSIGEGDIVDPFDGMSSGRMVLNRPTEH